MAKHLKPSEVYSKLSDIAKIKGYLKITNRQFASIYECVILLIIDELANRGQIRLPKFGVLYITHITAHNKYVNNFGIDREYIWCEDSIKITFKPSDTFKSYIENNKELETRLKKKMKENQEKQSQRKINKEFNKRMLEDNLISFIESKKNSDTQGKRKLKQIKDKKSNRNRFVYCEEINKTFKNASECCDYFLKELNKKITIRGVTINCAGETRHHHDLHFHYVDEIVEDNIESEDEDDMDFFLLGDEEIIEEIN